MCRRSTVSSSEPNWPEESSRPHAPDDQGWYTLGGDGWSTSGDQGWYTSGDHARYTSGDCAWSSLGRSMTLARSDSESVPSPQVLGRDDAAPLPPFAQHPFGAPLATPLPARGSKAERGDEVLGGRGGLGAPRLLRSTSPPPAPSPS